MTQDSDVMPTRRRFHLQPLAVVAALLGVAAFAAALGLKSVQVGRAPADYYGILKWFAPEIGLAPLAALLGVAAVILAGGARDVRSGGLGLLGCGMATAGLFVALTHAPPNAADLKIRCMTNLKAIAAALTMYEADHGALPPAAGWTQALGSYVDDPAVWNAPFTGKPGYALNAAVAGRRSDSFVEDPASVVAVFESDRGADAVGGAELLPHEPRHHGGNIVGYLDGHVSWVHSQRSDPSSADWIIWNPNRRAATPAPGHRAGKR